MFAKLMDRLQPSHFPALSSRASDWTGEALNHKLQSLDLTRPSHQDYVRSIKEKLEELLKSTWEYQEFGSIMGMQNAARRHKVSVVCLDYLIDYAEVAALVAA